MKQWTLVFIFAAACGAPSSGADAGPGGDGDGGNPPGCDGGLRLCGERCVDTDTDPLHCGECDDPCGAGETCAHGVCQPPQDCREVPCTGLTYCDLATGQCKPGCAADTQCGANEVCNMTVHECVCDDGYHRCGGACASDSSPLTCGNSCAPCPVPSHGVATCSVGQCGVDCDGGYHDCSGACVSDHEVANCGSSCIPCPDDPLGAPVCDGTSCGVVCDSGALECSGSCAACPTGGVLATGCSGDQCVATLCAEHYWTCEAGCCDGFGHTSIFSGTDAACLDAAFNSSGAILVSFFSYDDDSVHRVVQSGGGWNHTVLASELGDSTKTAIADHGSQILYWNDVEARIEAVTSGGSTLEVWDAGSSSVRGLASDGGAHIAFRGASYGSYKLYYGEKSSGWHVDDLLGIFPSVVSYPSVAADPTGKIHLVFRPSNGNIIVEWEPFNEGDYEVIGSNGSFGSFFSGIEFDGSGDRHVLYKNDSSDAQYVRSGSASVNETVPLGSGFDCDVGDFELDADDTPVVVCGDRYAGGLKLAYREPGGWHVLTVHPEVKVNTIGAAVLFDADNRPHIIYADQETDIVYHAYPGE